MDALPLFLRMPSGATGPGGDQVLLIVPSLDLILVRLGGSLADDPVNNDSASMQELDDYLFGPLMEAVN